MSKTSDKINKIVYSNEAELINAPAKKNMDLFIHQVILGNAYGLICGGVFLSGYLLYLGASETLTSFIPIMGAVCGIFLVFFANYIQSQPKRKSLLIPINFLSKLFTISSIIVPLVFPPSLRVPIVFSFVVVGGILSAINGLIFNTWYVELIPNHIKGRYLGLRQLFAVITTMIVPIVSGFILDSLNRQYAGYVCLFAIAIVVGGSEILVFNKIDEVEIVVKKDKSNFLSKIALPLSDRKFMSFLIRNCLFHLFLYMSGTFTQIIMIQYLKLSFTYINMVPIISSSLQIIFFLKFWGIITDKLNLRFVYNITVAFFVLDMVIWAFITSKTYFILLPLLHVLVSIEWSALNISLFNLKYEYMPKDERVTYDALYSFSLGVVMLISPFVGSFLRNMFSRVGFLNLIEMGNIRGMFVVSAVCLFLLSISNFKNEKKTDENSFLFKKSSYEYCWRVLTVIFRERAKLLLMLSVGFLLFMLFGFIF